jgi:predicted permease
VVVSDGFWRRQLGPNPSLDDARLEVFGMSAQVIGVMPAGFDFPGDVDVWFPLDLVPDDQLGTRTAHNFRVVGRLAPGASIDAARQELTRLSEEIRVRAPESEAFGAHVRGLREDRVGDSRRALLILLGASAFVLLVACTNLASALLARAARRRQELAVRASLGASRLRLVRQLLTESAVLAVLGAVAGLGLATLLLRVAILFGSDAIPRLETVRLDGWVLGFTTIVALGTALVFGTAPALRATAAALREGGRGTDSPRQRRVWSLLVGSEVAVALLLLIGSGLLIRSFQQLMRVDPGFEVEDRLAVELALPASRYADNATRVRYFDALLERVRALPGVEDAAVTRGVPLVDSDPNGRFDIEGGEDGEGYASYRIVSPGFFQAAGTPILRGRDFTDSDREGAADVIIVNRRLAAEFFGEADPIGRRMRTGGMDMKGEEFATIVGIVADVRFESLEAEPDPAYYLPHAQRPHRLLNATLLVHSPSASALAGDVRRIVRGLDEQVAVDVATLTARTGASLADRRFMLLVLGVFAAIALLLAGVGIYGVVAFSVAQRTREIAIRVALGAATSRVLWSIGRTTVVSVAAGIAIGLIGATWLARLTASLLYEVRPVDPVTFVLVALVLAGIAAVAVLVPARRALYVSPLTALRGE